MKLNFEVFKINIWTAMVFHLWECTFTSPLQIASNVFAMAFGLIPVIRVTLRFQVMGQSCFDRYKKIVNMTRVVATVCGVDVFRPDYKMNFITWSIIVAVNGYYLCTLHTIYTGYVVNGDWKIILQSLAITGAAVQGYCKLIFAIRKGATLRDMEIQLANIYEEYQQDEDFMEVLRYRTDLTEKILKWLLFNLIFVVGCIILYPLIASLFQEEKLLIMQFFIPGVDATTYNGYIVHNLFHAFLICLGGFGNFAADMFIFIFIIHVPLLKDILKVKFVKLNREILKKNDPKDTIPTLKDIVSWHQKYNAYACQVENAYYVVIFVQIFTSVIGISCTLFSIVIRAWPAAFAFFFYSASMMYGYCALGNLVEISNDELIELIYAGCLWYELPTPQQKLVLLMLRKAQAPTSLTVGQIMPLSMSTALQLTKAIYSYMMMLLNFLESDEN